MATAILALPAAYLALPHVSQPELEDLIVQANPMIEEEPDAELQALTALLRSAVEPALVAYRQSHYLNSHPNQLSTFEQYQIADNIAEHYEAAFKKAAGSKTVAAAFFQFLRNMLIEEEENAPRQHH